MTMSFEEHVIELCRTAFFISGTLAAYPHARLSIDYTKPLVHIFVTSRLDYCDALLFGLPDYLLQSGLQPCYERGGHSYHLQAKVWSCPAPLFELHWLPVRQRVAFKILLNTFKASMVLLQRTLLSLSVLIFQDELLGLLTKFCWSSQRTSLTDLRAFSVCEPFLWNSLPFEIKCNASVRIFKAESKTYLFRQAYIY